MRELKCPSCDHVFNHDKGMEWCTCGESAVDFNSGDEIDRQHTRLVGEILGAEIQNALKQKDKSILQEAEVLINGDRQDVYSHPADDFAKVATMTQPILDSDIDPRLKHALYMIQVKIARLLSTPDHRDSIVDVAGYAGTYEKVLERIADE